MRIEVFKRYASAIGAATLLASCGGSPASLSVAPQVVALHHQSETFICTRHRQSFMVPDGVMQLRIIATGATGGGYGYSTPPAAGGLVKATISVTPGEKLALFVGCAGPGQYGEYYGGFNGGGNGGAEFAGGGGGASDVRQGGAALSNRVVVAGGGGGFGMPGVCGSGSGSCCRHNSFCPGPGGEGGNLVAASGSGCEDPNAGGGGGSQSAGGHGGVRRPANSSGGTNGEKGHAGFGGEGGEIGEEGGGGGGGGGGYYGGGGGGGGEGFCGGAGGGGGSSYVEPGARRVKMIQGGGCSVASCIAVNGVIIISWK